MQWKMSKDGQERIAYDSEWFPKALPELFDPDYLREKGMLSGTGNGRGAVWFFHYAGKDYVLRHYCRGGKAALLLEDCYLWTGWSRSRPAKETRMLGWLVARNFPVPAPVSWRVVRSGLAYRADIVTARIPQARSLTQVLCKQALALGKWRGIGALLRRLHDLQIWHADLNLGNILLRSPDDFFLLDFDRCRARFGHYWKKGNLKRLHRSCLKEKAKNPDIHFAEQDFRALLRGYEANTSKEGHD